MKSETFRSEPPPWSSVYCHSSLQLTKVGETTAPPPTNMRFPKKTVVTATTVVDANVVEMNVILHQGEAGGMVLDLDCIRLNVEVHLDRMAACPAAGYPTRV